MKALQRKNRSTFRDKDFRNYICRNNENKDSIKPSQEFNKRDHKLQTQTGIQLLLSMKMG